VLSENKLTCHDENLVNVRLAHKAEERNARKRGAVMNGEGRE
jgi:hypothetical protein